MNDCIDNPAAAVAAISESALGEMGHQRLPQSYMGMYSTFSHAVCSTEYSVNSCSKGSLR